MSAGSRDVMRSFLAKGTAQSVLNDPRAHGLPVSANPTAAELQSAIYFEKEMKRVSRRGIKQKRWSAADKLKVCLHMRRNKTANRVTVGMEVLGENVPHTTVFDWIQTFERHPHNVKHQDGPDELLEFPTKRLGRPSLVSQKLMNGIDRYMELFGRHGVQIFRQSLMY